MPDYSKKIIYLSKAQYQELITNESITVDGVTINYNENDIYVTPQDEPVTDVQVNETSVVQNGVASIPSAKWPNRGWVTVYPGYGIDIRDGGTYHGMIQLSFADDSYIKKSMYTNYVVKAAQTNLVAFHGLANAAGDTTQQTSSNVLGTYTENAKSKISDMLNAPETVSSTTPTITAKSGVRYICGECSTLTITAPESGCIDVTFTSGSTPTVLTVSSAKANTTIKFPAWFDPTSLDANTTYEVNILDGEFGVVTSWA